jgi:hypothetical protein
MTMAEMSKVRSVSSFGECGLGGVGGAGVEALEPNNEANGRPIRELEAWEDPIEVRVVGRGGRAGFTERGGRGNTAELG